jgi:anti-sigma B factor antagonist
MVFNFTIQKQITHATLRLSGELIEKGQAVELLEQSTRLTEEGCHKWAIDLAELKYMNSSGLNTLITLLSKARTAGGEAVLYGMNKKVNDLIIITKLNTLFKVASTEEDAHKMLDL